MAFSSDGNRVVSSAFDQVQVCDAKTGEQLRTMHHPKCSHFCTVVFSPDDNQIVSVTTSGSAAMWNAKTGKLMGQLEEHVRVGSFASVAFSTDGSRIVTGSYDRSVRVWMRGRSGS